MKSNRKPGFNSVSEQVGLVKHPTFRYPTIYQKGVLDDVVGKCAWEPKGQFILKYALSPTRSVSSDFQGQSPILLLLANSHC
jgi:hypothetical protein